ncbi:MAG: lectin MOA-related protein [Desulfosarcina sp.]|nr:lectin MOA-related protein [Desulfobacterales bacterium]
MTLAQSIYFGFYLNRKEKLMKPLRKATVLDGATISRKELRNLITSELDGKLSKKWCLHTADANYYLPRLDAAKKIIADSNMQQLASPSGTKRRGECFDCDDFSLLLKARFAYAAYSNKEHLNRPYCFGIVWGMLPFPFPHSMNWIVTDDKKFYFIEPQRQEVISLEKCKNYRFINLMLV